MINATYVTHFVNQQIVRLKCKASINKKGTSVSFIKEVNNIPIVDIEKEYIELSDGTVILDFYNMDLDYFVKYGVYIPVD